jgi:hypothetical protein
LFLAITRLVTSHVPIHPLIGTNPHCSCLQIPKLNYTFAYDTHLATYFAIIHHLLCSRIFAVLQILLFLCLLIEKPLKFNQYLIHKIIIVHSCNFSHLIYASFSRSNISFTLLLYLIALSTLICVGQPLWNRCYYRLKNFIFRNKLLGCK